MSSEPKSFLQLVSECDNFPYPDQTTEYVPLVSRLYRFYLKPEWDSPPESRVTVGFILPVVAQNMPWVFKFRVDHTERTVTVRIPAAGDDGYDESDARSFETAALAEQLQRARDLASFDVLRGWRDEPYPVHGVAGRDVRMERSGSALFGIHTVGVHMTGFVRSGAGGALRIWVPRRAPTKQTYPGMLDNTVAGGIAAGEDQFECLVREAAEEASLAEELVRERARPVGSISYVHVRDSRAGGESGLIQPETQYLYDIELPEDVAPAPADGEVEKFYLWEVDEVVAALRRGEFKPNCAVCLIDFLVRHGEINAKNEADYFDIISRIHRRIHF